MINEIESQEEDMTQNNPLFESIAGAITGLIAAPILIILVTKTPMKEVAFLFGLI